MTADDPRSQAQHGLALLKEAILRVLEQKNDGLSNAQVADLLDIRSDYQGSQKDYLSWSVLGLLLNEGKVVRDDRRYLLATAAEGESQDADSPILDAGE